MKNDSNVKSDRLEGDRVVATQVVTESGAGGDESAVVPDPEYTHAVGGDTGMVVHVEQGGLATVRFDRTGTSTIVHDREVALQTDPQVEAPAEDSETAALAAALRAASDIHVMVGSAATAASVASMNADRAGADNLQVSGALRVHALALAAAAVRLANDCKDILLAGGVDPGELDRGLAHLVELRDRLETAAASPWDFSPGEELYVVVEALLMESRSRWGSVAAAVGGEDKLLTARLPDPLLHIQETAILLHRAAVQLATMHRDEQVATEEEADAGVYDEVLADMVLGLEAMVYVKVTAANAPLVTLH